MTCSSIRGTAAEPASDAPAGQLLIDTYETPGAESLLRLGRERHSVATPARRLLVTEAGAAVMFVVCRRPARGAQPRARALSVSALAVTLVAYLIAARVQYPVGSSWTAPTQLVFVPMLFVLPTPWVPLIVAACSVADQVPAAFRRRLALTRLLARVGDSFYALGPALVLVLFHGQTFSWNRWPVLLLAFGAQIAFDAGAGLGRTWFAERIPPCVQLPMVWLYATDACLSCIGLLVAASAVVRPGLVLLALPLVGLLAMLARERRQRLEYSLALSTAYRDTTKLLAQSQGLTQELQKRSEALRDTNDAARGEGTSAVRAEPRHRGQERGDRARAPRARGKGHAAGAVVEVQVRVPGEHVARAPHAAELDADPVPPAGRERERRAGRARGRVRAHDPLRRR